VVYNIGINHHNTINTHDKWKLYVITYNFPKLYKLVAENLIDYTSSIITWLINIILINTMIAYLGWIFIRNNSNNLSHIIYNIFYYYIILLYNLTSKGTYYGILLCCISILVYFSLLENRYKNVHCNFHYSIIYSWKMYVILVDRILIMNLTIISDLSGKKFYHFFLIF